MDLTSSLRPARIVADGYEVDRTEKRENVRRVEGWPIPRVQVRRYERDQISHAVGGCIGRDTWGPNDTSLAD